MINIDDMISNAKIMVIEDKQSNLEDLYKILSKARYTIQTAATGEQAITDIDTAPPDLFLLHTRLPDLDGTKVCRKLKSNRKYRDIPVILIEVPDNTLDRDVGCQSGAVGFINRPYDPQEVLTCIESQLKLSFFKNKYNDVIRQLQLNELIWL
jgi:DNA-binding response OmpR family regulator